MPLLEFTNVNKRIVIITLFFVLVFFSCSFDVKDNKLGLWHSTTAIPLVHGLIEVVIFGGCEKLSQAGSTGDSFHPKASSTIIRFR